MRVYLSKRVDLIQLAGPEKRLKGDPMNSFQIFVHSRLHELRLSRVGLVTRLGYRNSAKGLRRLDAFLHDGSPNRLIEDALPAVLEVSAERIQAFLTEIRDSTHMQEGHRAIEDSRPFLHVVTERAVPSQITLCGFLGMNKKKRVLLPEEFWALSAGDQQHLIGTLVREHMQECDGWIPFFGRIRFYVLFHKTGDPSKEIRVFDTFERIVENSSLSSRDLSVGEAVVFHKHYPIRTIF